jgi:adenylate cyclase
VLPNRSPLPNTSGQRKLAVILHADIVGSTMLVQQDAEVAHQRIQQCFRHSTRIVQRCDGRTVEIRGDAMVSEFKRASDALLAALHMQQANTRLNTGIDDDITPQLRVGIALGEVVIANKTITGDGVVLAQRLEQIAEPGGICVQGSIYEAAPRQLPVNYHNIGKHSLKGFAEPIQAFTAHVKTGHDLPALRRRNLWQATLPLLAVALLVLTTAIGIQQYYLTAEHDEPASVSQGPEVSDNVPPDTTRPSIAVLAFDSPTADDEQAYFASGIAEDILTELSRLAGLKVIARSASFAYRDQPTDINTIGRELQVAYLLDGSVRRAGSRIRLNVQLIEISSASEIWSERYDRELADIFEIQREVTELIVDELRVKLTPTERSQLENTQPVNTDAYDLFLRGLARHSEFNPVSNEMARDYFIKATLLDPNYARAHASVALSHSIDVNQNWTQDREQSIRAGLESVDRALEIDDRLPQAYFAQGSLFLAQRRHASAVAIARRGIELAPSYADGHAQLAFYLTSYGAHEESLQRVAKAKALNPRYTLPFLMVEAIALFQLERYEEVIALLAPQMERNPEYDRAHLILAAAYAHLGQTDDAEWSLEEALTVHPDTTIDSEKRNTILRRTQDLQRYLEGLRLAGLQ